MTVAVAIVSFEAYDAKRRRGELLPGAPIPCPKCSVRALYQSASMVTRSVRTTAPAREVTIGARVVWIDIALARCRSCKHRPRILPAHLPPYKRTTVDLIEELAHPHVVKGESLRGVASRVQGVTIAHASIHAWTEGLGDYALGRRAGEVSNAIPGLRIVAEAGRRHPEVREIPRYPAVLPGLYRSEARRVRLQAVLSFLLLARCLSVASPLADLAAECLRWTGSCHGLAFRSGRLCTPSEHPT